MNEILESKSTATSALEILHRTPTHDYIELHASSAFSFLESSTSPESYIERAIELDMPAMALTDRNGLYGIARFHTSAKNNEVKAHIGAEIAVSSFGHRLTPPAHLPHQHPDEPPRIVLLCKSQIGYQNLCQLITRFKMREPTKCEGAATFDDLEEFSEGLICLTGGDEGPLTSALASNGESAASQHLDRLISIYGRSNLYIELQRHHQREQESRNISLLSLASKCNIPIVATNGVRCATPQDRELLDVFTSIRNHTTIHDAGRLLCCNSFRHLRPGREMHALFLDLPEAIANTRIISQRLEFALNNLGYEFPRFPVPDSDTMDSYLAKRVDEGIRKRFSNALKRPLLERALKQARHELALIAQLGFAGYFLIVWDIIRYCQLNGFLVQGRGSAANSVVCYALEITAVDPIGMELLFERFLSESRGEWPDIDLDLPSGDHREKVIQHIYEKYGALGAAMTANVITYRGRSAAREVGKVLGFDEQQLAKLSSLVGHWEWRGANDTMDRHFDNAGFDVRHPRVAKYLELCSKTYDLPRHLGQHSGGMVICAGMLNRIVPIERASMPGRTVVQWDKEDCADLGLIKVDLLGLGMMAVLKDSLELIPHHYNTQVDLAALPEDPLVYKTLRAADTVGMFQVESRAQMASLPHNAPRCFYDVVVQVAIIRPGPIVGKMMHPYMRRRQGLEEVSYPHPLLEPVLKRTLGVPLFQEQLLRMAMVVASFSGSEAEELRRAVGMRRSMQRMRNLEGRLREGMTRNGVTPAEQDNIVQAISSFAMYGFPESHAASFALIAYASAYLKVYYLAAFLCGLLNNQPMGFYAPAVLIKDAQRHGLKIRPMCIQRSEPLCTIEHESDGSLSVRIGFNYAKGLRQATAEALTANRNASGPFSTIEDLAVRVPQLSKKDLVTLAQIGALNTISQVHHRRDALWQVEEAGRPVGPLLRASASPSSSDKLPLKQMTTDERLAADYSGTGLTCGPHPMSYQRASLKRQGYVSAGDLSAFQTNTPVRIAGCVIARQRPGTAKGFVFLSMEDETGIANVIITPDLFERDRVVITRNHFLDIEGTLQIQRGVIHVKAHRIRPIDITSADMRSHDFH
ncbi:DNA polymerase III subunit alpha [Occallatibacter savannae]|uniref:DNA polymerase III subunit alpha n=1 Tax=Occallatibacter savannae TaxID=1002691 RepID=UPI000D6935DB|nr:error-prone DNA polymerase [Occallatibacter savannae]